jgi:phage terminase large subunit GpA-like protein
MIIEAIRRLRGMVARAWRPIERVPPDVWCETHVRMSDEHEASRGLIDLTDRPWWRDVLLAAVDPEVRTITIPASTQVGKTLSLCMLILYLAKFFPASALVVCPDKRAVIEFRDRLYSLAAESGFQIPPEYRWNLRYMNIGGMRVYLSWSGSKQGLRGRRCKYVFLSELDVYACAHNAGDPVESARQRVKAFPRHLIFQESSPIPEPSRIDQLEKQTDQRRWVCQCPDCGVWQELRFFVHTEGEFAGRGGVGGLKDADGNWVDPDVARRTAHYVCLSGCKIYDDRKTEFVKHGVWVPRGCKVHPKSGKITGTPARGKRDVGFQLWAAHSNAQWGTIAAEYLRARLGGLLPDYFQNWLGRSYKQRGSMPTWQDLAKRLSLPSYPRAVVPADAWFLTASSDVQEDEVYCVLRGWGDRKTSWLVDWWVFDRESGDEADLVKSDLLQLNAAVLDAWFPVQGKNPRGRTQLQVVLLGCDAKYRTLDVHNWIQSLGAPPRIRAVQGDGTMRDERYKENVVTESRRKDKKTGERVQYHGGLRLWSINSLAYRRDLASRFQAPADQPGAWLLPAGIMETGRHYLQQLVNEPPITHRGKDGRQKLEFRERDSTIGHDFWDCEVNGDCLADMFVDQLPKAPGWDATKWLRPDEHHAKKSAKPRPAVTRSAR